MSRPFKQLKGLGVYEAEEHARNLAAAGMRVELVCDDNWMAPVFAPRIDGEPGLNLGGAVVSVGWVAEVYGHSNWRVRKKGEANDNCIELREDKLDKEERANEQSE